jgi:chromosome partitioning protein
MKTISVSVSKGGTGKTSLITAIMGVLSQKNNIKPLLIDMDGQGNATTCMGIKQAKYSLYHCLSQNVPFEKAVIHTSYGDVLGGNILLNVLEEELFTTKYGTTSKYRILRKFINEQITKHGYTHCLIDNAPNFGNNITISLMACDSVLIPIIPSELSIEGIMQFYEVFQSIQEDNPTLKIEGVIFNMCNIKTKEYKRLQLVLKKAFGNELLDFVIPTDQKMVESQNSHNFKDNMAKPCTVAFPYCRASLVINDLVDFILRRDNNV